MEVEWATQCSLGTSLTLFQQYSYLNQLKFFFVCLFVSLDGGIWDLQHIYLMDALFTGVENTTYRYV